MLTLPSKAGVGISECSVVVSPAPRAFPRGQGSVWKVCVPIPFLSILLTYMIAKWRNVSLLILRRSCVRMCPKKLKALST